MSDHDDVIKRYKFDSLASLVGYPYSLSALPPKTGVTFQNATFIW